MSRLTWQRFWAPIAVAAALILMPAAAERADAGVAMGAFLPGADTNPRRIGDYKQDLGRTPAIVGIYKDWGNRVFEEEQLSNIWGRGSVPMITWEPWGARLRKIAHGRYDRYVRAAARAARRWDKPVFLRFAHEMNGDWYPWGEAASAHAYKAAWRHLVRIFRKAGADNVRWVWTPYVNPQWDLPFTGRFPGDRWVDWVGLDGINWGGGPSGWRSFKELFGGSYRILRRISSRPMILAEVGCGERGGDKARWVSAALRKQIPRMGRVHALVWWSKNDSRGDLRINSSGSALRALRRSARLALYGSGRHSLLGPPAPWHG
jgi:mannan endo-1,4-beta-mannosidase